MARYLVATGNSNSTSVWAETDGGAPGASVPDSSQDVYLTATSGAVTLTINANLAVKDFNCTGFTGTLGGDAILSVAGNFTLVSGMTYSHTGRLVNNGSGTTQATFNGKAVSSWTINGSGSCKLQLMDALTCVWFWRYAGSFDANGQTVTLTANGVASNPIYNGGETYTGLNSFYNLVLQPSSPSASGGCPLTADITVANNLTINNGASYRYYIYPQAAYGAVGSVLRGTSRTITCNGTVTVSGAGVDYEDITGAGTASWDQTASAAIGDCGGNSGITFTGAQSNWLRGSGNRSFSTAANWANAVDGAAGSGRVPLPQDTAYLDATTGAGTITQDLVRIGALICTGHTGTLTTSTAATGYGSITVGSGSTLTGSTQAYTLSGRSLDPGYTLTSNGKTWAKAFTVDCPGGKWKAGDAFLTTGAFTHTRGTWNENDQNVTVLTFDSSNSNTRALTRGSGTLAITGNADNMLNLATLTGMSYTAGTGTIKFTGTLTAARTVRMGALTHANVWNATSGAFALVVRDTCGGLDFKVDPGRIQHFYRGETRTFATWNLTGTAVSPITLASDTTSAATIAKSGGGTVNIDYATIDYLTGSPASTFYAFNSTDGGHNSQIYFAVLKTKTASLDGLLGTAKTKTLSLDAKVGVLLSQGMSLDAILGVLGLDTLGLDAYLQANRTSTLGLDSYLGTARLATAVVDAYLQKTITRTASLDAVVGVAKTAHAALDSLLGLRATFPPPATTRRPYPDVGGVEQYQRALTSTDARLGVELIPAVTGRTPVVTGLTVTLGSADGFCLLDDDRYLTTMLPAAAGTSALPPVITIKATATGHAISLATESAVPVSALATYHYE